MRIDLHLFFAFLVLSLCTSVRAQTVSDDFSDGDLLNPAWQGDTDDFIVMDGRLRLMADGAGSSRIFLDVPDPVSAPGLSLSFLVEMDFAPSGSNFTEIELLSCDGGDCTSTGSIRVGGISGSDDRLEVTLTADGESLVLNGASGALGSQPAIVRFTLNRNGDAWSLQTDYSGGNDLLEEASGSLANFSFDRFEVRCNYTSTRADRFSFDDFMFTAAAPVDNDPPVLVDAQVLSATAIGLTFSEGLEEATATNVSNYSVSMAGVNIAAATLAGNEVTLTLDAPLTPNESFTVNVLNARDIAGNLVENEMASLTYFLLVAPRADNVVLNEFLADPTPIVGLPNAEYIELFNPGDTAVDASLLSIASGGGAVPLPADALIPPGGYLVVTNNEAASEFRAQGVLVAAINLPSLTNSGDIITLLRGATILTDIRYTDDWYNDPDREDGGYSIEYVGMGADAGCSGSWKASEDASGGTPGRENSVLGRTVDNTPPAVAGFNVTETTVDVVFNETLDPDQITVPGLFSFDNNATITAVEVLGPDLVRLSVILQAGLMYTLSILPDYSDCSGNFPTETQRYQLAIPATPEAGDVIINELLFNPASGGSDFLELFNCSDKVFQIEGWSLRNTQSTSQSGTVRTISATRLFLPGEYLTLTADPDDLLARYLSVDPALLVDQALPGLPNDEGNITVVANGVVLDAFDYSDALHSALIADENGVSLERIRQKSTTQDANNWFSAAQAENFATPTRENSQQRDQLPPVSSQTFSLVSQTFSPNGDSFEDILEMQYTTDRPGFVARIRIFDAQGRPIRTLRQVELLAGSGTIRWDGSNDEGRRARAGAYVLFIELFNPDGEVREEQLTAVLAGFQ